MESGSVEIGYARERKGSKGSYDVARCAEMATRDLVCSSGCSLGCSWQPCKEGRTEKEIEVTVLGAMKLYRPRRVYLLRSEWPSLPPSAE